MHRPSSRIYGILGLLDPRIVAKIEADYSIPVWKTYSRLVLAEKEVYQKLNMLNHCNIITRCEGHPSWVPNWDQTIEGANTGYLSIRRFYASARSSAVAKLIEPAYHLQVVGRRVATICRVGHNLTGTFAEVIDEIFDWPQKNHAATYTSQEDFPLMHMLKCLCVAGPATEPRAITRARQSGDSVSS
jgi:hypothetical protein